MLRRLRSGADRAGVGDRVHTLEADLDVAWPDLGTIDMGWAVSSLHHIVDRERLLRDIRAALSPGGVMVVAEMEGLVRFLPDDVGQGKPGLEARCHRTLAEEGWNAHPDWEPHLQRSGFEMVGTRTFEIEAEPSPTTRRYAHTFLSRIRTAVADRLGDDDLDVLDRLLHPDHADSVFRRPDLTLRSPRRVWVARRPPIPTDPSEPDPVKGPDR